MKVNERETTLSRVEVKIQLILMDIQIRYDLSLEELAYILSTITARTLRQNWKSNAKKLPKNDKNK